MVRRMGQVGVKTPKLHSQKSARVARPPFSDLGGHTLERVENLGGKKAGRVSYVNLLPIFCFVQVVLL